MAKLHDEWKILPHGPLEEVEPGLLTVVGQIPMPLGNFPRRMTVVGLTGSRTAIWSPIALGEAEMERIEALGEPAYLIIPNPAHRLDARPFRSRYPQAKVLTAPNAVKQVAEAVPVDGSNADLGEAVELITVAGVDQLELAMLVRHGSSISLITNDIIGNVGHPVGPGAWIMSRLMAFGPTPRIPRVARSMFIKDPAALASQLRDWAELAELRRIIPSHGDIIDRDPAAVLLHLAQSLDN
ncbi:MAG TPA: hypothetical protein VGD23_12300 [Sphingomicrobium sp.]